MKPVVNPFERRGAPAAWPQPTHFRKGDWIVLPEERIDRQAIEPPPGSTMPVFLLSVSDPLPLRTVVCYYAGMQPLERRIGPRLLVEIRRVTADFDTDQ
jgi:hypothetical protein